MTGLWSSFPGTSGWPGFCRIRIGVPRSDAITAEMDQIDRRYRDAVQALNVAVAATEATAGTPYL